MCRRSAHPRSAPKPACACPTAFPKKCVPLGFCCGGFTSTAGYVPGNEVQLALDDYATASVDQFRAAQPVFIRAAFVTVPEDSHQQAFRLQRGASIATSGRLRLPSNRRVAAPFADPLAGHASRKKRDRVSVIRPSFEAVNSIFFKPFSESTPVENSVEIIR